MAALTIHPHYRALLAVRAESESDAQSSGAGGWIVLAICLVYLLSMFYFWQRAAKSTAESEYDIEAAWFQKRFHTVPVKSKGKLNDAAQDALLAVIDEARQLLANTSSFDPPDSTQQRNGGSNGK